MILLEPFFLNPSRDPNSIAAFPLVNEEAVVRVSEMSHGYEPYDYEPPKM